MCAVVVGGARHGQKPPPPKKADTGPVVVSPDFGAKELAPAAVAAVPKSQKFDKVNQPPPKDVPKQNRIKPVQQIGTDRQRNNN